MQHLVFCYQCQAWKTLEIAGDLGQYSGDTIECPCKEDVLVPKYFEVGPDSGWGLFHIADLEPASDLVQWLRLHPKV
jgi:hypothetical protein